MIIQQKANHILIPLQFRFTLIYQVDVPLYMNAVMTESQKPPKKQPIFGIQCKITVPTISHIFAKICAYYQGS